MPLVYLYPHHSQIFMASNTNLRLFYFQLQRRRIRRKVAEWGLPVPVSYGFIGVLFVGFSLYAIAKGDWGANLYAVLGLSMTTFLNGERRLDFLKSIFSLADYRRMRLLENVSVIAPFSLMLLLSGELWMALALFPAAILIVLWPFKPVFGAAIPTPFSRWPFEYAVGFRKAWPFLVAVYGITGIAFWVDNYALGLFASWLIYLITLSFHYLPEHEFYIWIYHHTPQRFLRLKTGRAILFSTVLCMPVIVPLCFFYPDRMLETAWIVPVGCVYLAALILAKYSAYPHEMSVPSFFILTTGIFFPPFLVLFIPFFYRKAIRQLRTIL